jgi:hypothetical protein
MPAPVGNKNNTKNKPWTDALRRALARYADDDVKTGEALNHIATQYVKCAVNGDKDAITELANRLDGKPAQSVLVDEDSGPLRIEITKRIVNASD